MLSRHVRPCRPASVSYLGTGVLVRKYFFTRYVLVRTYVPYRVRPYFRTYVFNGGEVSEACPPGYEYGTVVSSHVTHKRRIS